MAVFKCVIVGEGNLPQQCGQFLLDAGHSIAGVVSPDDGLRDWARRNHLADGSMDDLDRLTAAQPFDYLLCIFSFAVIPTDILERPRRFTVNYHDSLLPEYAGFNVTSWAIAHGETRHGVSWHVMTDVLDAGDLLLQREISIAPDERAYSLNAKCYEAAVESFHELANLLATGAARPAPQALDRRTLFPLEKRPPGLCAIDWQQSSDTIVRWVNALDFGPINNPVGLPTIAWDDAPAAVLNAFATETLSTEAPGTLVALGPEGAHIATGSTDLVISRVAAPASPPCPFAELPRHRGVRPGDTLPALGDGVISTLTSLHESICLSEPYWAERLGSLSLPDFISTGTEPPTAPRRSFTRPLPSSTATLTTDKASLGRALASALGLFFVRVGTADDIDIGVFDESVHAPFAAHGEHFASFVPVRFSDDVIPRALDKSLAALAESGQHGTFLRNIVLRYSALAFESSPEFPVLFAIGVGFDFERENAALGIRIDTNERRLEWSYDPARLAPDYAQALSEGFETFLANFANYQDAYVSAVPIAKSSKPSPSGQTSGLLHDLFERQVAAHPTEVAVTARDGSLTYAELDARACALAHAIHAAGVTPGERVALLHGRSTSLVVAMLAVLKSGAAYVPIDPGYPRERIDFMLSDAEVSCIIAPGSGDLDASTLGVPFVASDAVYPTPPARAVSIAPEDPAYILYTSGTTGRPKGVVVSHANAVNHMAWMQREFPLGVAERVAQKTPISFDASVWEFYAPLNAGATIVLSPPGAHEDPHMLARWIATENINVLQLVPTVLRAILSGPGLADCDGLQRVFCGGEALTGAVQNAFFQQSTAELVNLYGPSECTVDSTFWRCRPDDVRDNIPIGFAIDGATLTVTHRDAPVPDGMPGELWIGGAGVASGYLNRPELTADRFIANTASGERLYRSGDLVRTLPDGSLEFLGRVDDQIKLRGFRIELGEIARAMEAETAIEQAAVIVRDDAAAREQLVGYYIAAPGAISNDDEIRDALRRMLPEYMVPSTFVRVEHFPLSPSGKLDRAKLPRPEAVHRTQITPPRTPVETTMVGMWNRLLGYDLSIDESVFDAGGHSLLAMEFALDVAEQFQVELPLAKIFERPTIAELAECLVEFELAAVTDAEFDQLTEGL